MPTAARLGTALAARAGKLMAAAVSPGRFLMIREAPAGLVAMYVENWLAELLSKVKR